MFMQTPRTAPAQIAGGSAQLFPSSRSQRIAQARQQFFDEGVRPTGLVGEAVIQSWMRCASGRHDTREALAFNAVSASRMHAALARNEELLAVARQELQTMEAALSGLECRVLLTDGQGVIVHGTHNPMAAHEPLLRQATRVGVNLVEARMGTTAPGITTHSGQACTVTGAEHYFDCLQTLECAAAPIHDVRGQLAAVLDITVEGRSFNFDAASVVGVYATLIENRLLLAQSREHVVLRFQASPALLATPMEALAGITANGQVAWLNVAASRLLGVPAFGAGRDVPSLLGIDLGAVLAMTRQTGLTPIRLPNGLGVWAQASVQGSDGIDFGHALAYPVPAVSGAALAVELVPLPSGTLDDLATATLPDAVPVEEAPSPASLSEHHHHLIDRTLAECGGNISRAARALGVSRGLLYRHLRSRQVG
jgi:sigma-54 dependent transcriptional regulator, acetoin dehydrogenase operon transcriptional activator AcoR